MSKKESHLEDDRKNISYLEKKKLERKNQHHPSAFPIGIIPLGNQIAGERSVSFKMYSN